MLEINPLIVTKDGHLSAWTPRSRSTRTASTVTRRSCSCATSPRRTRRDRGLEVRPRLHRARRHHRLHGQRRGSGHGDPRHHQALRRGAGELPRCRRRRLGGEGHRGLQDHHRRPEREGILVNIFGGIMKCDVIANGVIAAVKTVGLQVPLVVRLEGTNVEKGKEIIRSSGLNVIPADDLDDAAQKIVARCARAEEAGRPRGRPSSRERGPATGLPSAQFSQARRSPELGSPEPTAHPRMQISGDRTCPSSSTRTPRSSARGFTRKNGTFHSEQAIAYGTKMDRRHLAGKAARPIYGSGVRHREGSPPRHRRRRLGGLRAAAAGRRRRRDLLGRSTPRSR